MSDAQKQELIKSLFSEIKRSIVENSAVAFSPNPNGGTSMILWTGGSSRDNRMGDLSIIFKNVSDERVKFDIKFNQKNLKTKRESTPLSGEFYLNDQNFYKRLNRALKNFGGQDVVCPVRMPNL